MMALGVDPGTSRLGLGYLYRERPSDPWYCREARTVRYASGTSISTRLSGIWDALVETHNKGYFGQAWFVACEDQSGAAEGHRRAGTTNASAGLVEQVVGLVHAFAFSQHVDIVLVTPAEAKRILPGMTQKASKAQVGRAIRALVRDCPTRMSEHASDALAVAIAGSRKRRP